MRRDEFTSLPLRVALGIIYDVASSKLRDLPAPELPRPPKFDYKLGRKGGFVWASELELGSLKWWHGKAEQSARDGGEYAERDAKRAAILAKWIEWRELYPSDRWNGTRDEDRVTAEPPSREPKLREWPKQGGKTTTKTQTGQRPRTSEPPPEEDDDFRF